ncbi:MAG: stage II sporulation protein M, partial [Nanoarchaeota archaeon]|nr:stage II sporulation protein M [Nanoarchaeota archaeon]
LGLASLPYAFLKFFIHGIPEILAYFAAALAGSILFITVIRGDIKKDRIKRTFIDISIITIISIILLVIAAGIEAYISPHL